MISHIFLYETALRKTAYVLPISDYILTPMSCSNKLHTHTHFCVIYNSGAPRRPYFHHFMSGLPSPHHLLSKI
jgi:hypothetical protein